MSEEMKQTARELVLKSGHVTKDGTYYQSSTEKLLELIAQVCEQREKELISQIETIDAQLNGEVDLRVAAEKEAAHWKEWHGVLEVGADEDLQRAEAAELALRSEKLAHADTHLRVQAKEQELATVKSQRDSYDQLNSLHIQERDQARQQAIAGAAKRIQEFFVDDFDNGPGTMGPLLFRQNKAFGYDPPDMETVSLALCHDVSRFLEICSLTPPPALTKEKSAKCRKGRLHESIMGSEFCLKCGASL